MPKSTEAYAGGLTRAQVVSWRNSLFVIFALCGIGLASWMARIPAVKDTLRASTAEMGLLLLGLAIGSIVGLLLSSHLIARFGARANIAVSIVVAAIGLALAGVGISLGQSFIVAFAGLAIFGIGMGLCDVSMNLSGAVNERVLGRTVMPIFHAFFSIGTMVGAGLGALAELIRLPLVTQSAVIAVVMIGLGLASVRGMQSEHILDSQHEASGDERLTEGWRARLSIWADPRTLLIGVIVLGMAFTEGSANDWLSLAMVDGHGVDKATGAVVFGVFVSAMTVGRLAGVRVLDRFGRVPVLRASALLAAIGLLLFILAPTAWLAVVGVVLWGLGAALGFPTGMSAAADDPRTAAARVSAVATIGYCAFLVGPPLIGFLGEQFGILNALYFVLVLIVIAGAVSHGARSPRRP